MTKPIEEHMRLVHEAAIRQDDIVPFLQDMFDEYGEAAAEALLVLPDLPEEADLAKYTITHAVERIEDHKYVETLLRQLPLMADVCPRFMTFLVRRMIRSPSCFEALQQRLPDGKVRTNQILLGLFRSGVGDTEQKADFRERCRLGIGILDK